ncbi:MAG: thioredoxin-disulfide reductase [Candidatus Thermoplasmatota archaeon]|nr:thioredoxin-disulfide reductase [Candidatus Thermoplasmatota archaeon]MCL5786012.1 thioredoxin-disulfide reductase [Candidatus Thermoplasmatota archaeon]
MVEDLIIIGSGPAGLTAALYTARENYNPLVIAGQSYGGQLQLTTSVENFPAFPEGILGPELVDRMRQQAEKFGARFINEDVTEVDFSSRPFKVFLDSSTYESNCIIVATGASARWLGIPSEQRFIGRGVSSCATCDAPLFRGRRVVVVGGGDSAMEDSLFLTKFVEGVTIVHRNDKFRASKIMRERVLSNPRISVLWNSIVQEVKGDKAVSSVSVRNIQTGETSEIKTDGLFVAIGHSPNTSFLKGQLDLDDKGYVVTQEEVLTAIKGIFVAGDVSDRKYRQAITAAGSGSKAALEARAYLLELNGARS